MNLRKVMMLLIAVLTVSTASAKFRFGPTAGVNFSRFYWSQELVGNEMRVGYSAGVLGEVMIPGIGFGVDFALKYANRGGYVKWGEHKVWSSDGIGDMNLRYHELQVPVNLRFKWTRMDGLEDYIAPIGFLGPTFNFNLGTNRCEAINFPTVSVGLQCGAGVELFKRYQLTAGYIWDVTHDLKTRKLDDLTARIQGAFIDVTVLF